MLSASILSSSVIADHPQTLANSTSQQTGPPRAKLAQSCLDVVDFPAHLRVRAGLHSGRDEERKLASRADVTQPTLALFDRLESEFLRLPSGIGVERLRDAPSDWSRQHAMLGLPWQF
jgi:hypothetical protein